MLGIVVSHADSASVHIGEQLRAVESWDAEEDTTRPDAAGGGTVYRTAGAVIREFDERHLDLERPADAFESLDLLVFASRHSGETGPLLTAHHTGNFGPADHGGEANELAEACPNAHAAVIDALDRHAPEGYDVGMECTHHGPSDVGAPSMFVEVGSSEPQWADTAAARAVARAILDLRGVAPHREAANGDGTRRQLVGFGGGHYVPRFERVLRETDWTIGHIAADWGLDAIGEFDEAGRAVLVTAFERSRGAYALVDGDRPDVVEAVEAAGYRAVSETWVRETVGIPLSFVRAVEDQVCTVEDGLRFGDSAAEYDSTAFETVTLPAELLDVACGIDRTETRSTLVANALAIGTAQGGTRPTGPAVVVDRSEREQLIDGLLEILGRRYDSVERDGATVVARELQFDPDKARTLDIPEGPAFGRLADGESVEVNGRTITPETVQTEAVEEFSLE